MYMSLHKDLHCVIARGRAIGAAALCGDKMGRRMNIKKTNGFLHATKFNLFNQRHGNSINDCDFLNF
jgi:hypothetical protein